MAEVHGEDEAAVLPRTVLRSGDLAVPLQHIAGAIMAFDGFGDEAERVVAPPIFSLFFESVYHQFVYLLFLHYYQQLGLCFKPFVLRYAHLAAFFNI